MPQGRHTALTIHLTDDEHQRLTQWQRSTTMPAGLVRRGRIILLLAERMPIAQIARTVGLSRRFVYKWASRFQVHGIAGLADTRGHWPRPRQAAQR